MIVLDHFADWTRLPVQIKDVRDFVLARGFAVRITFHPEDVEPNYLAGMNLTREYVAVYGTPGEVVVDIPYSTRLTPEWQRLVLTKELIHACDVDGSVADKKAQVERLIREIVLPLAALRELDRISQQAYSDHSALILALAVLVPLEAGRQCRALFKDALISQEEISSLFEIPLEFVNLVMDSKWEEIITRLLGHV